MKATWSKTYKFPGCLAPEKVEFIELSPDWKPDRAMEAWFDAIKLRLLACLGQVDYELCNRPRGPLSAMQDSADTDPEKSLAAILRKAQRHL